MRAAKRIVLYREFPLYVDYLLLWETGLSHLRRRMPYLCLMVDEYDTINTQPHVGLPDSLALPSLTVCGAAAGRPQKKARAGRAPSALCLDWT